MGSVVLDTSVVIAWFDPADAHHREVRLRLDQLRADGIGLTISTVSYAELRSSRNQLQRQRAEELADALGERAVIPVDRVVAERAGEIRSHKPSVRLPDALIAATAYAVGADTLLTTDRRLARLDGVEYVGSRRKQTR